MDLKVMIDEAIAKSEQSINDCIAQQEVAVTNAKRSVWNYMLGNCGNASLTLRFAQLAEQQAILNAMIEVRDKLYPKRKTRKKRAK